MARQREVDQVTIVLELELGRQCRGCSLRSHWQSAIPCHRLLRSGGGSSGYRWRVERKLTPIKRESKD